MNAYSNNFEDFDENESGDFDFLNKFENKVFNHKNVDKTKLFFFTDKIYNKFYSKLFLHNNCISFDNNECDYGNIPFLCKVFTRANRISYINKCLYNKCRTPQCVYDSSSKLISEYVNCSYLVLESFIDNNKIYNDYKYVMLNYIFCNILDNGYNNIENEYKNEFFKEIQGIFLGFIKYYGLYQDIKDNVDKTILYFYKFDEIAMGFFENNQKNEIFTLWVSDNDENEIPLLAHLSLKSMVLCGHDVILYTYKHLDNIPNGVQIKDANEIIDASKIFRYKEGHKTYSGFANLFRLKRLYEFGGTWVDLDILLINNINDNFNDDIIIVSEPTRRFYLHPNNAIMRFPKHDPLVKFMLDFAQERGSDVFHGETGPKLLSKMLKTSFKDYNRYLKHFNFNNMLKWNDLDFYSNSPEILLNKINMDEIVGFHFVNTFFKKIIDSFDSNSFFGILKRIILISNSKVEYKLYLTKNKVIKSDISNNWDLKFLKTLKSDKNYTYTVIIDAKNLKKAEIYNIFHSIGVDESFNLQIFIFSRTSLPLDKVKFNDDVNMFASSFEEMYEYVQEYIKGEYVIPINKAIMFDLDFFKDKNIVHDIEHYILNKPDSFLNIFSKESFESLSDKNLNEIFNLSYAEMDEWDVDIINNYLIFEYNVLSSNVAMLIDGINYLNDNFEDFSKIKDSLLKLNFNNIVDEVSYYYFTAYKNIISSKNFEEFKLKEKNADLDFLTSFYLNKINPNYQI